MTEQKNAWEALSLKNHGYIEASAGTGKTYTIENLVVRILTEPKGNPWNRQIDLEELCIVTYTEKATEELRYRIRRKLEAKLAESLDANPNSELIRHIQRCLTRFDRAAIFTIHGFCNRFLTAHAFESQSMFGEENLDAVPLAQTQLRDLMQKELLAGLWDSNEKISETLDRWKLSGIDSFYCNVLSMILSYDPQKADCLRPQNAAKQILAAYKEFELKYCIANAENHPYVIAWKTIKSALQLKKDKPKKGLQLKALLSKTGFTEANDIIAYMKASPLDGEVIKKQTTDLLLPVASESSEDYRDYDTIAGFLGSFNAIPFREFCRDLDILHSALRENEDAARLEDFFGILNRANAAFIRKKQEHGIRTFDDMILSMHAVLYEANNQLLPVLRKRFRYGIIDEFQDTNTQQWDIFKKIFVDDAAIRPPAQKSFLYVVGDPKQSIFSFQGSDVSVYLRATRELRLAKAKEVELVCNYRSSTAIVDACNCLFSAHEPQDWFLRQKSDIAYAKAGSANTVADVVCEPQCLELLKKPLVFKQLYAINPEHGNETRTKAEKQQRFASWICDCISYLTTSLPSGKTPLSIPDEKTHALRNCNLADTCILIEKHSEALGIMKLLRQRGIPYTKQRNKGLFASMECLQLLIVLDAVLQPQNVVALKKAMLTKFIGQHATELENDGDTYDAESEKNVTIIFHCATLATNEKWGEMFGELFGNTSYLSWCKTLPDVKQRVAAMRQLRNYCMRRLLDNHDSLAELVARLRNLHTGNLFESEEEDIFQKETESKAVKILTMHSAKGLEFPFVFLACGKGTEKSRDYYGVRNKAGGTDFWFDKTCGKALYETEKELESRRLYYVALSRAKFRLFLPLWDAYDFSTNSIVHSGKRHDANSASVLFLSRIFHAALREKNNARVLSFEASDNKELENALKKTVNGRTAYASNDRAAHEEDSFSKRDANRVATPNIIGTWPVGVNVPAKRTTFQQSYSGLVRIAQKLGIRANPGADEIHDTEIVQDSPDRVREILEPSAKTGNALHDILEQADFAEWTAPFTHGSCPAKLVENCLRARGMLTQTESDWQMITAAADCVRNSLNSLMYDADTGDRFTLADIPKESRKTEAEFYFAFDTTGRPFAAKEKIPDAMPKRHSHGGWIMGFMDLLFCRNGKYYIVDWKSNLIANRDYSAQSIKKNMDHHLYDVQYKVYGLALHWWLSQRIAGYDPVKHFGGIAYVYLRGTLSGERTGIWMTRPTVWELENEWPEFVEKQVSLLWGNGL